jgi:hypothetical protein
MIVFYSNGPPAANNWQYEAYSDPKQNASALASNFPIEEVFSEA